VLLVFRVLASDPADVFVDIKTWVTSSAARGGECGGEGDA
jgi:hypothetical protein